jgi:hypothetical protein
MYRNYFFVLCISIFIYSCSVKDKNIYPVIFADDKYTEMRKAGDTTIPQNYQITSLKGFILDCSQYDFSFIKQFNKGLDADLLFINCASGSFTVKLNLHGKTVIDSISMTPFTLNNRPFIGFVKGELIKFSIGFLTSVITPKEMAGYWSAKIEIK